MKRYLICALAAVALALNASAKDKDKEKDKDKYEGLVATVPDAGNTALLLGTALLVFGVASRRFARR
jgi:protein with PEP-CTERM/exosortase system signal